MIKLVTLFSIVSNNADCSIVSIHLSPKDGRSHNKETHRRLLICCIIYDISWKTCKHYPCFSWTCLPPIDTVISGMVHGLLGLDRQANHLPIPGSWLF